MSGLQVGPTGVCPGGWRAASGVSRRDNGAVRVRVGRGVGACGATGLRSDGARFLARCGGFLGLEFVRAQNDSGAMWVRA